ncbi:MAG: pyruvate dehydrogenase (acetyl-transferring) E1 component subunit alpha [candidate division NC10 bacterium]|jgi:pyruvate dehydrogenase E1 component alpha subunit|nr:pyruvate dehydrogenase (acetyl-transferring) E1 component subunit alpha [candidate division NC10 bacterium]
MEASTVAKIAGPGLDKKTLLNFLHQMLLIRKFEDKSGELYARGKIAGFLHLYNGQEASAVGAISTLAEHDLLITHYRDHGYAIARGLDLNRCMAELLGKATGIVKGHGGSMHFFDVSLGMLGGWAIVAGHLPLAVGLGLASNYLGKQQVVLCVFGDGATNNGYFHEALNMAKLWKVPVVFLCENNLYGMGTAVHRASATLEMSRKAAPHGIPAQRVDGMDVLAVREATTKAVEHARRGDGPFFLEVLTYRFRGHSMADPILYRDKAEVEEWKQRDPIVIFRQRLEKEGLLSPQEMEQIERETDELVVEAVRFAEESPDPPLTDLYKDIYADP